GKVFSVTTELVREPNGITARRDVIHHPGSVVILAVDNKKREDEDRKSTRLNSSHRTISYAVFCLKKKTAKLHLGSGQHDRLVATPVDDRNRRVLGQLL